MYAIKPEGRAYLVGCTVGSLAVGIGMRWRETYAEIIEQRPNPYYEQTHFRRCVMSENSLRLLRDLGFPTK